MRERDGSNCRRVFCSIQYLRTFITKITHRMRNRILYSLAFFAIIFQASAQKVYYKYPVDYTKQEPTHTVTLPSSKDNKLKFYGNNLYLYDNVDLTYRKVAKVPFYAEMSISNDTSTVTFAATTPTVLQDLTAGPISGFTMISDSLLRYDGNESGVFRVSYSASLSFTEAANILNGYVQVNGVEVTRSRFRQTATTANTERINIAGSFLTTLAPDALLRFMLVPSTHTGSDDILVYQFNLNIVQLK